MPFARQRCDSDTVELLAVSSEYASMAEPVAASGRLVPAASLQILGLAGGHLSEKAVLSQEGIQLVVARFADQITTVNAPWA